MDKISALVYDIEILNAIPDRGKPLLEGVRYCGGWGDHAGMGIACIGAYDYLEDRYRVFTEGNVEDFFELVATRRVLVSFNGIQFDNAVMRAHGAKIGRVFAPSRDYDIMAQLLTISGVRAGLDACCSVNFGTTKSGDGAMAPVDWQRGLYGKVIDYCLNDVKLTKQLFDRVLLREAIIHPKTRNRHLLAHPETLFQST